MLYFEQLNQLVNLSINCTIYYNIRIYLRTIEEWTYLLTYLRTFKCRLN